MRFGLSLFGGAVTGLVMVAGAALSAAQASGQNEVTKYGAGSPTAVATAAPADVRRTATAPFSSLSALAQATGAAQVEFKPLPVVALGSAYAAPGASSVEFFAYGFGDAKATTAPSAGKRTAKPFPKQAQAKASGTADGETWQLGYAKPAVGTARGFGTTFYVGGGTAPAFAAIQSLPAIQLGAKGHGIATGVADGTCLFTSGGAGLGEAPATGLGDAAITSSGIRYMDANGVGECLATALVQTVQVHQTQTATARATIQAQAKAQIGAKGRATARCTGYGNGLGVSTAAAAIPGTPAASASGRAKKEGKAKSTTTARATGYGDALVRQTRVSGTGVARATAQATVLKTLRASASVVARATVSIWARKTMHAGNRIATARATGLRTGVMLEVRGKAATSFAMASGYGYITVTGGGVGVFTTATATGFNQINDLERAPADRTVIVTAEPRVVIVETEPRTLFI
jgi:hypothetical protein